MPGVNPANGIPIGDIIAGDFINVTFRVQVVSIPNPIFTIGPGGPNSPVVNSASINYQFMTGPNLPLVSRSTTSNPVSTQINSGEIVAIKSVNKTFATIGDTISYTITLSNPGNVTSQNIILRILYLMERHSYLALLQTILVHSKSEIQLTEFRLEI